MDQVDREDRDLPVPAALRPLKIKTATRTTTLTIMRAVNHGLEDDAIGFFCSAGKEMQCEKTFAEEQSMTS